jgi:alanyl-tRNA synthetase
MAKSYAPRMHSAEHILNRTMVTLFDCDRSFSAHINKKKSKCDYHFDRDLTEDEVQELERRINAVIDSGVDVTERMMPRDDAAREFNLKRLPDEAGETLRIVDIGEYDACPCIGVHVDNTSEIGAFRMVSHSFEDGVLRLRYKLAAPAEASA